MTVLIFRQIENNMQQGHGHGHKWLLRHDVPHGWKADPLTGWQGQGDTRGQVTLTFPDAEAAVAFAQAQDWDYRVIPDPERKLKLQSYANNFSTGGTISFD